MNQVRRRHVSALLVSDERRLRESNPAMHGFADRCQPGWRNRRWRPFPHGRRRTPLLWPDRPVPAQRENRREKPLTEHRTPYGFPSRREIDLEVSYGLRSETRRGIGRSGVGWAWLPSVDSNHDAGIQNPVCCRLHQRGRVCALAGSWTGLRKMNPSPPPSFPRSAI